MQEQKTLEAAEHLLGWLVGSTHLPVNIKELVGSYKGKQGFLAPSLLLLEPGQVCFKTEDLHFHCPAEWWMPWSCCVPGP